MGPGGISERLLQKHTKMIHQIYRHIDVTSIVNIPDLNLVDHLGMLRHINTERANTGPLRNGSHHSQFLRT